MTQSAVAHILPRHGNEVATCLDLIAEGISYIKSDWLHKYYDLLQSARNKVYGPTTLDNAGEDYASVGVSSNAMNDFNDVELNGSQSITYPFGGGLQLYADQISNFYEENLVNMDEGLTAWYGSVMDELHPNFSGRM